MNSQVFSNRVKNLYAKYFPDSYCHVDIKGNFYRCITIKCYLAEDKTENYNNYWDNDLFHISFCLDSGNKTELPKDYINNLPDSLELTAWHKHFTIKPNNKYCVYGHKVITFRKCKGDTTKILIYLDKVFKGIQETLRTELENNNIHKDHIELVTKKLKG